MPFSPTDFETDRTPLIHDVSGARWHPILQHECSFDPEAFDEVMMNLVENPNINSSWLFRADILYDSEEAGDEERLLDNAEPIPAAFEDFRLERTLVRRMIPRNTRRDKPLDQTCLFLRQVEVESRTTRSLVIYIPHESSSPEDLPFYHPKVRGVAHLHEWDAEAGRGTISLHYRFFRDEDVRDEKMRRTARMLLSILHKHGQGTAAGYVKRVHHDVMVPRASFQDRYSALKLKYARRLVETWAETTDPVKHVFEDLGIAAFLIELWADIYKGRKFPGFVDIGCGNGLLVYILLEEGYAGWGFDARARRSWVAYGGEGNTNNKAPGGGESLQKLILLPRLVSRPPSSKEEGPQDDATAAAAADESLTHDGLFPDGTFIISNHADELTPWTPILAAMSRSPFIMIPCCSHDLGGAKFRAPPPRDESKGKSTYASLVEWVSRIAADCGWVVEMEMLRIPSTRNTALVGRTRMEDAEEVNMRGVVDDYGGTVGFYENAIKLAKTNPRGH